MHRSVPRLLALAATILLGACATAVTGPATVTPGQTATFNAQFFSGQSATNATGYAYVDLPAGWTFQSGTYTGTVNGAAVSGAVAPASDPGICVLPAPAVGYQRQVFSVGPFPAVAQNDSLSVNATFVVNGAPGAYTVGVRGAANGLCQGSPTQAPPPPPIAFGVVVGQPAAPAIPVPTLGTTAVVATALLLLAFAMRRRRTTPMPR